MQRCSLAQDRISRVLGKWEEEGKLGICPLPDEVLPPIGTLGFRVQRYGMLQWGDLFTARQKIALMGLARLTSEVSNNHLRSLAAFGVSKQSDFPTQAFHAGRITWKRV